MLPSVLFVDDDPSVLEAFRTVFRRRYAITVARNGLEALDCLKRGLCFDVIISDIMMPGMNGLDFLVNARKLAPLSVRIALTGHADMELVTGTVNQGHVYKFLTKPCRTDQLEAAIQDALDYARRPQGTDAEFSRGLLAALDFRNLETSAHVKRVGLVSALLAKRLGWSEEQVGLLREAAPLHDIGKIGIPDAILLKPGKLSDAEYAVMKDHARIGAEMLRHSATPLLAMAREIAWGHHEHPDGTGYPTGRVRAAIPWSARIVSVADVHDALVSARVYREPLTHAAALALIAAGRDTHFDPQVVDALFADTREVRAFYG